MPRTETRTVTVETYKNGECTVTTKVVKVADIPPQPDFSMCEPCR